MALQVTQANPGTISGVSSAPTQSISGVSQSPVSNTNVNPQAAPAQTSAAQPASTAPIQGSSPNIQPAATNGQTFSFMNGMTYDLNGNQVPKSTNSITAPPQAEQTSPAVEIKATTPPPVTPSSTLGSNTSNSGIQSSVQDSLNAFEKMLTNLATVGQISPQELSAQQQTVSGQQDINQAQLAVQEMQGQAAGVINPGNQAIALPFLTGQAANKLYFAQRSLESAQLQQQVNQMQLQYAQGNRVAAFNMASTIFDASQKSLETVLDVYTKSAPQNIGTTYNQYTGDITGTFRNPMTGAEYSAVVGNAGVQQKYISSGITNVAGVPVFYGVKPDGSKEYTNLLPAITGNQGTGTTNLDSSGSVQGLGQISIPGYGGATNPQSGQAWRTDSNNNPLAAAMKTGSSGNQFTQALDQEGIKWTQGSAFASDPSMSTIKILGNPVEGARAILSNSNALSGWYAGSTGKAVMAQYGIKNANDFKNAPLSTQNAVIDGIYKAEGGSGILMHPQNQNVSTPQQVIDQVGATLPYLSQGSGNVGKTFDGRYYIDTSNLSGDQASSAGFLVPYYAQQAGLQSGSLKVLGAQDVAQVRQVSSTQQKLNNLLTLTKSLPTSGSDPQRLLNMMGVALGVNPNGAAIDASWSALVGEVNSLVPGATGARLASSPLIGSSLPNAGSIQALANQLIALGQTNLSITMDNIFGGPPPADVDGYLAQLTSPATVQNDAYLNFATQFLTSTSPSLLSVQ